MADYNSKHTGKAVDDAVDRTGFNLIQESSNATYKTFDKYKPRLIDVIDNAALKSDMPKAADDPIDIPKPILEGQTGSVGTSSKYARADHIHAFDGQVTKSFVVLESFQYWKMIKKLQSSYNWIQIPKKDTTTPNVYAQYSIGGIVKSYDPTDSDKVHEALEKSLGLTITSDNVIYGISDIPSIIKPEYHEFVFDGIIKIVPSTDTVKINVAVLQPSSPIPVSVLERISGGYILLWYRYYNNLDYRVAFAVDRDGRIIGGVYTTETGSTPRLYLLSDFRDGTMWSSECYVTKYNDTAHIDTVFRGKALQKLQEGNLIPNTSILHQYATFYPKLLNGVPLAINGNSVKVAREDHVHSEYAKATDLNVVKTDVNSLKTDVKALKENVVIDDVVIIESAGQLKVYKIKPSNTGFFDPRVIVIDLADPDKLKVYTYDSNGSTTIRTLMGSSLYPQNSMDYSAYKDLMKDFFGISTDAIDAVGKSAKVTCKISSPTDLIEKALSIQTSAQKGCYTEFIDRLRGSTIYTDATFECLYKQVSKILTCDTYAPDYQHEKRDDSWRMTIVRINGAQGNATISSDDREALLCGDIPQDYAVLMTKNNTHKLITSNQVFNIPNINSINTDLASTYMCSNVANTMYKLYTGTYTANKVVGMERGTAVSPSTELGLTYNVYKTQRSIVYNGWWQNTTYVGYTNINKFVVTSMNNLVVTNNRQQSAIQCVYDRTTKRWTNKIVIDEEIRATTKANEVKSLIRIPKYNSIQTCNNGLITQTNISICHLHFRMAPGAIHEKAVSGGGYTLVIKPEYLATTDTSGNAINLRSLYQYIRPIQASVIMYHANSNPLQPVGHLSMPIMSTGCYLNFVNQCFKVMLTITGLCHSDVANLDAFKTPDYVEIYGTFMIASS
jgi:hypothetical protein